MNSSYHICIRLIEVNYKINLRQDKLNNNLNLNIFIIKLKLIKFFNFKKVESFKYIVKNIRYSYY